MMKMLTITTHTSRTNTITTIRIMKPIDSENITFGSIKIPETDVTASEVGEKRPLPADVSAATLIRNLQQKRSDFIVNIVM